eukprot:3728039-Lingulodinium_polyedra.AAC.1
MMAGCELSVHLKHRGDVKPCAVSALEMLRSQKPELVEELTRALEHGEVTVPEGLYFQRAR